jgi:hypothetical protein
VEFYHTWGTGAINDLAIFIDCLVTDPIRPISFSAASSGASTNGPWAQFGSDIH